jgi:hypothetical protein
MKSFLLSAILSAVICVSVSASGATWYVDGAVSESGNGLHPWTAFKTIQEGVDAGNDGDTVNVAEGMYVENILFRGRNIVLLGNGAVIDGNQAGSVVRFTGTENETCVLSGFTIQNGRAEYGGGIWGGDWETDAAHTRATIRNNLIKHNSALVLGGGLVSCDGMVRNNLIVLNSADNSGGGLYGWGGTLRNNTVVANSAPNGGGLYPHHAEGTVVNCIIWGNTAAFSEQLHPASEPSYCCIEDWTGGGEGNFSGDPRFVDPENGDYRLLVSSPCIDSGLNESWMSEGLDLDGNERIIYGRSSLTVDIGAYEFDSFPLAIVGLAREGADQGRLTWFSRDGDTYAVWSCVDLCGGEWGMVETVPSQGGMTSWTDSSPLGRVKFYRVEMK